MPLGIVSDQQFESELNNSTNGKASPVKPITTEQVITPNVIAPNVITGEVVVPTPLGRGKGNIEVPSALRKVIADEQIYNSRKSAIELASYFDISHQSVDAYKYGTTSLATFDSPTTELPPASQDLKNHITNTKNRIIKKAHNKLALALSNITSDKLSEAKVKDLAVVARSLSGVIKDMEPDNNQGVAHATTQFIVYQPRMTKEEHYETINVSD